jgi:osmotically-inducible protein OsmY
MFRFLLGGIVGALLLYFLDPQGGNRRRNLLVDKAGSLTGTATKSAGGLAQDVTNRAQGLVTEKIPHKHDNTNPDNNTLQDRVESELFRDPTLGRDKIVINVIEDGIVQIRGQLASQAEIQSVVARVKAIRDVKGVESFMHTPGTPAPNKESAINAS